MSKTFGTAQKDLTGPEKILDLQEDHNKTYCLLTYLLLSIDTERDYIFGNNLKGLSSSRLLKADLIKQDLFVKKAFLVPCLPQKRSKYSLVRIQPNFQPKMNQ